MRKLTLNKKITIKGKLNKKGLVLPKMNMKSALFQWRWCYGSSISEYYKVQDYIPKRKR